MNWYCLVTEPELHLVKVGWFDSIDEADNFAPENSIWIMPEETLRNLVNQMKFTLTL